MKESKPKKKTFKVVAIEFNNTTEAGKNKKSGELQRVAEELEKHLGNFKRWGYAFRVEEYPQGMLVIGERESGSVRDAFPFFLAPFMRSRDPRSHDPRPPQDPVAEELASINPEHVNTINRVLLGMDRLPSSELTTALPALVADITRGMPSEVLREVIATGEKVAESHAKHQSDPSCTLLVRVRQVVDVMKKQVQLQTS
jgi:hypothetical protein